MTTLTPAHHAHHMPLGEERGRDHQHDQNYGDDAHVHHPYRKAWPRAAWCAASVCRYGPHMTPEQLVALIPAAESDVLEMKAAVPDPGSLARLFAGFANSRGGVVLLGVHELHGDRVVGVDAKRAEAALHAALPRLDPPPEVRSTTLRVDGKEVVALEVAATPLTLTPDGLFVRRGAATIPATQEQAKAQVSEAIDDKDTTGFNRATELGRLAAAVAHLTTMIDIQRTQLESLHRAGAWPRQLLWVFAGAVLGAIATLIIS
jgi:hypothetical protein